MLNSTTIAQLNRALENSFGAIKRDINQIKLVANSNSEQFSTIRKQLDSLQTDSVSKDKINVLKIKLGEVNEDVKKIWDLEKQVKAINAPTAERKIMHGAIDDLNAKLVTTQLKLGELGKQAATETQLKTVVSGINAELNKILSEIRNVEIHKDELGKREMNAFEQKIGKRFDNTYDDIEELRKEVKNYVNKNELKSVLSDVNDDFDSIKKDLVSLQKESKSFVKESEVKILLNKINKEFDDIIAELNGIRKQNKEFVTANQIRGLIDDVSNEFDEVKGSVSKLNAIKDAASQIGQLKKELAPRKEVVDLKKSFSDLQKEMKQTPKVPREYYTQQKSSAPTYGASMVYKTETKKTSAPYKKTRGFGNFLIVIAFLCLIGSIVSYFINVPYIDTFAIAAAGTFVVGMILRIIAVLKSK